MATDAKAEVNVDLRAWAAARAKEIKKQYDISTKPLPEETQEQREARAQRFLKLLKRLEEMGTEEERRESCEFLMKALAETRREEGRVF